MRIYLDHNAGSPLRPNVRDLLGQWGAEASAGNPASVHHGGQSARKLLEDARHQLARLIGASARQIIFTSGGTESNNLAIFGAAARDARRRLITSVIEHSSVLAPVAELERRGFEAIRVPVDREGRIDSSTVNDALTSGTALVTLGLANSEVGVIQNLACLADPIRASGALFHVDAVQAAGRIPVSVDALGCDLMTLSGHKLGTPAGIGALYIREPERMMPLMFGGPQESALRPGTPNLLGAVAFGVVARTDFSAESERIGSLSMHLLTTLRALIPGLELNGPEDGRLPNTLNMAFPGVAGESMLMALDLGGVEVSMGSACAAGSVEPSHVLLAMGQNRGRARSSIRLSLGWCTTGNEVEQAAREIVRAWRRVREVEPMIPAHEDLQ